MTWQELHRVLSVVHLFLGIRIISKASEADHSLTLIIHNSPTSRLLSLRRPSSTNWMDGGDLGTNEFLVVLHPCARHLFSLTDGHNIIRNTLGDNAICSLLTVQLHYQILPWRIWAMQSCLPSLSTFTYTSGGSSCVQHRRPYRHFHSSYDVRPVRTSQVPSTFHHWSQKHGSNLKDSPSFGPNILPVGYPHLIPDLVTDHYSSATVGIHVTTAVIGFVPSISTLFVGEILVLASTLQNIMACRAFRLLVFSGTGGDDEELNSIFLQEQLLPSMIRFQVHISSDSTDEPEHTERRKTGPGYDIGDASWGEQQNLHTLLYVYYRTLYSNNNNTISYMTCLIRFHYQRGTSVRIHGLSQNKRR